MTWSWAWWLAVPVAVTVVAALLTWRIGRESGRARLSTEESVREHDAYLAALGRAASRAGALAEGAHMRSR